MKRILTLAFSAMSVLLVACGPAQIPHLETVKSNETAFVIPLEGANKDAQKQLMSVEYLEANKVAAKRIEIPQREVSTGRMPWDYKYIDTVSVLKVDRTPVSREWTKAADTGTSKSDQAFAVESVESIDFKIGGTLTASVPEDGTAKFLYYYNGQPLSQIIDSNVKTYLQSILSADFGSHSLDDDRKMKAQFFAEAFQKAKEHFKQYGIEIDTFGYSEGMTYTDSAIQTAINKTFVASQTTQAKQQEVQQADYEMQAAEKFQKAAEARTAQVRLQIEQMKAQAEINKSQAALNLSTRITQLPNEVPQGSPLMLGFSTPRAEGGAQK